MSIADANPTIDPSASAEPQKPEGWSLAEALLIGLAFFGLMTAVAALTRVLPLDRLVGKPVAPFVLLPLVDVLIAVAIWWLAGRHHDPAAALGISAHRLGRHLLLAVAAFIAVFPVIWLVLQVNQMLAERLGLPIEQHPLLEVLEPWPGLGVVVFLVVYAVLVRPMIEELYFRGFLYPPLRRVLGAWPAILVNGALFALPHLQWHVLLPLALLGMLLAFVYERTHSLPAVILIHALNNGLTVSLVFIVLHNPIHSPA